MEPGAEGEPAAGGQPFAATPAPAAQCAVHEDAQATGTCGRCGNFVCPLCLDPLADRDDWCEACRERAGGNRMAWEREEGGIWGRWWQTTRDVLFSPTLTFDRARPGSVGQALLYNALTGVIVGAVFTALGVCALGALAALGGLEELAADPGFSALGGEAVLAMLMVLILLSPLFTALYTLFLVGVRGLVYYIAILVVGGGGEARYPFWTVSYLGAMNVSMIPLQIIQQIPILGPILGLVLLLAIEVWYALQLTRAAERYHGLEGGRATFAGWAFFLLMTLLGISCCCGGVLLGMAGAGV